MILLLMVWCFVAGFGTSVWLLRHTWKKVLEARRQLQSRTPATVISSEALRRGLSTEFQESYRQRYEELRQRGYSQRSEIPENVAAIARLAGHESASRIMDVPNPHAILDRRYFWGRSSRRDWGHSSGQGGWAILPPETLIDE